VKNYTDQHLDNRSNPEVTLLIVLGAVAALLVLGFIPFAGLVTYPVRLFSTFVHETSHALAALVTFGDVHGMVVRGDGSGTTWVSGGSTFLVGTAGYLGTTLFGILMLLSTRKTDWSRWALAITGTIVLLVTSLYAGKGATWPVFLGAAVAVASLGGALLAAKNNGLRWALVALAVACCGGTMVYLWATDGLLTWILGLGSALVLMLGGRFLGGDVAKFAAAFLGVSVALNSLSDIATLAGISAVLPVAHTDAKIMATAFGGSPIMWSILWGAIALVAVGATCAFLVWEARRFMNRHKA
jgi:hypothetical protein